MTFGCQISGAPDVCHVEGERKSGLHLLHNYVRAAVESSQSFGEKVFKNRMIANTREGIGHIKTLFLIPTSNIVKRLFSKAGSTLAERCARLSAENF